MEAPASPLQQLSLERGDEGRGVRCPPPPHAALHNPAVMAATFACLDDEASLLRCSAVCRAWWGVLNADDVWQAAYARALPAPAPHERAISWRAQFARLRGVRAPSAPSPLPIKGQALCYNTQTGRVLAFSARQRMLSALLPNGSVCSAVSELAGGGTAHRPLLASTDSKLVVLAAADGPLELWDAESLEPLGQLTGHMSFVTSLAASGLLVASTCAAELRLWNAASRICLLQVPVGLPLPSPVLEPHVALCQSEGLLALANCAAPVPTSVVKIYSTSPAAAAGGGGAGGAGGAAPNTLSRVAADMLAGTATASGATSTTAAAAASSADPASTERLLLLPHADALAVVGSSSLPGAAGAALLRELPVNAAADMSLSPGLLLVASCFHGRAVSANTPYKSERPFTVVVHIWSTRTWQLTRLVSPRLWTDCPIFSMQGSPLIHLTQGQLLCASVRSGDAGSHPLPSCCLHAWRLPRRLARAAGADAGDGSQSRGSGGSWGRSSSSSTAGCDWCDAGGPGERSGLRLLSVSPSKGGGVFLGQHTRGTGTPSTGASVSNGTGAAGGSSSGSSGAAAAAAAAAATSNNRSGSSGGSGVTGHGHHHGYGNRSDAITLGRAAAVMAGGDGSRGGGGGAFSAANTVMLAVADGERDEWEPLIDDTQGRLTVLTSCPTALLMATEAGLVLGCQLLPPSVAAEPQAPPGAPPGLSQGQEQMQEG